MEEANKEIKAFLQKEKKAGFIDVYHAMLDKTGRPVIINNPDKVQSPTKNITSSCVRFLNE